MVANHQDGSVSVFELATAADLELEQTVALPAVESGGEAIFTVTVTNHGPANATALRVEEVLPSGLTLTSCVTTVGTCVGTATSPVVEAPLLTAGSSVVVALRAAASCDLADGTPLTAVARVEAAEQDPAPGDETVATAVVVRNPSPVLSGVSVSPNVLWPPDHKLVDVVVAYTIGDNCPLPAAGCGPVQGEQTSRRTQRAMAHSAGDWIVVDAAQRAGLRADVGVGAAEGLYAERCLR